MIHLRGHNDSSHVLHVVGDGKAEDKHHHNRHDKEYQHRSLIAKDVASFLYDK
jgi:hypothetical protein